HRQASRAELQRVYLQIFPADHGADGADRKCARGPEMTLNRQAKRTHASVRKWPVELGDGADRGGPAWSWTEADRFERKPLAARYVRGEVGDAAQGAVRPRLGKTDAPLRKTSAVHRNAGIDPQ